VSVGPSLFGLSFCRHDRARDRLVLSSGNPSPCICPPPHGGILPRSHVGASSCDVMWPRCAIRCCMLYEWLALVVPKVGDSLKVHLVAQHLPAATWESFSLARMCGATSATLCGLAVPFGASRCTNGPLLSCPKSVVLQGAPRRFAFVH